MSAETELEFWRRKSAERATRWAAVNERLDVALRLLAEVTEESEEDCRELVELEYRKRLLS